MSSFGWYEKNSKKIQEAETGKEVVVIVITVRVTRLMVRPLKQLTESAQKIANADLEVSIECNTKDEVGVLAKSFKQTVEQLRCYIEYINRLAYTDTLTKIQNKTAYEECIARLPKIAEAENKDFADVFRRADALMYEDKARKKD